MASLLFLLVWCVMFLEQCVSEKPSNAPMTYSAETDLQGQMFSVNSGGSVTLRSSGAASLSSFTVCLRHISERFDSQSFFSLGNSLGNQYSSLNQISGQLGFKLTVGRVSDSFVSFFLSLKIVFTPWTGLCSTWTSSSGMAQVWVKGQASVRKGMWRNQVFTGQPILAIYGFVGQVTDVHVWDYILSPSAIASFSSGKVLQEGTVLSWRRAQYNTGGMSAKQYQPARFPDAKLWDTNPGFCFNKTDNYGRGVRLLMTDEETCIYSNFFIPLVRAGSFKTMAETDDLRNFNKLRQKYIHDIAQNLGEARALMNTLNSNLQAWTERTGELEHLAAVWATFQNKLACISVALEDVEEDSTERDPHTPTSSDVQTGVEDG
ncbi:hypothetical protein SKAU_G00370560 [Synaphobranchus kaupii]|uniref:Pentraxin (PTX) domain-containing protein n=1 Tax=Synaphobranchus kaupii TaxID=118154 RepID=A0A9Q1EFZ6_SYNKA|nr:hypothetical protein SKAU_G00370560 [Synaphobranchus kaupii]